MLMFIIPFNNKQENIQMFRVSMKNDAEGNLGTKPLLPFLLILF